MSPRLSIIVTIYNIEAYLEKCIDSILNQTYQDFELILVEDGSPDRCGDICAEYAQTDERVRVIHQANQGVSAARNTGLAVARGKYLGFVDGDDYIAENMYAILMQNIVEYDADISQCHFMKVFPNSVPENLSRQPDRRVLTNMAALNELFGKNYLNTVVLWNKIYKTSLFKSIRFPVGKIHEDESTMHQLLFAAHKIVSDTRVLYYYYQSENSLTRRGFETARMDSLEAGRQRMDFFRSHDLADLYLKARQQYLSVLIFYYALVIGEKSDCDDLLRSMRPEINQLFWDLARERALSMKNWVQFMTFRISPGLYSAVFNLKGKLS